MCCQKRNRENVKLVLYFIVLFSRKGGARNAQKAKGLDSRSKAPFFMLIFIHIIDLYTYPQGKVVDEYS